jgi:hypothetical protein
MSRGDDGYFFVLWEEKRGMVNGGAVCWLGYWVGCVCVYVLCSGGEVGMEVRRA